MHRLVLILTLALAGCGRIASVETANMPYPVGTCFRFEGTFASKAQAYWPKSLDRRFDPDAVPEGSYVFILPVDHKTLTPISCEGVK
jgi:hypothetical protein